MIGPMGYFADVSRTFFCGPGKPTGRQKHLYRMAMEEIDRYGDEDWFAKDWDANFYAGTLLFRNRRYADAVPFLGRWPTSSSAASSTRRWLLPFREIWMGAWPPMCMLE